MTELIIDGMPVALPKGFDFKIKKQNPLLTKNGTYTLDLALSLEERNNAILYKHLDRLQTASNLKGRSALLVSDGHVVLNGTEAILSNTDKEVKIQLLSGNSELNYFLQADTYISEFKFDDKVMMEDGNDGYPTATAADRIVSIDGTTYNNRIHGTHQIRHQPYLLTMLEKLIMAMGYTISSNELLNDNLSHLIYMLNSIEGTDYSKFLPGWKAIEFLEQCERFFNITLDISETDKTVRILRQSTSSRYGTYVIENMIDAYERKMENETDDSWITYNNVRYKLPSSPWYKYQEFADGVMDKAEIIEQASFSTLKATLNLQDIEYRNRYGNMVKITQIPDETAKLYHKTLKLFHVADTDTYYMVQKKTTGLPEGVPFKEWNYLQPVNRLAPFVTDNNKDFTELEFTPAEIIGYLRDVKEIPCQKDKVEIEDSDSTDLNEYIKNGVKDYNDHKKNIYIAINKPEGSPIDLVTDQVDSTDQHDPNNRTLRLCGENGLHQRYYKQNKRYNTDKEYTISFVTRDVLDVRKEFLFQGKLFLCKELEYRITPSGLHTEVTGIFYEIK